jgi:DNA-3-methyladenine glycosylase
MTLTMAELRALRRDQTWFTRDVVTVARELIGSVLVHGRRAGVIVETEAYLGPEDGASHAAFRPGSRWLFYGPGGVAYVFSAYGIHACLNAIAGRAGHPGCVLVRALEPLAGLDAMARRRGRPLPARPTPAALAGLASGPGRLTEALGIGLRHNGLDLQSDPLSIHAPRIVARPPVVVSRRIGITRSADLPLRFSLRGSPFVSRPRP